VAETGRCPAYRRVCLEGTIPYARRLEDEALPSASRIEEAVLALTR
jgi:hypothetical protein